MGKMTGQGKNKGKLGKIYSKMLIVYYSTSPSRAEKDYGRKNCREAAGLILPGSTTTFIKPET